MLLRHAPRFVPAALLLFACGQSNSNGAAGQGGSDQQPTAGEDSGATSARGGSETAGGTSAGTMSFGNTSSSDAGTTTGGTPMMVASGGDAGQPPAMTGAAGEPAAGAPSGDGGAGGRGGGGSAGMNGGAGGMNGGAGGMSSNGGVGGAVDTCNDNDTRPCYTGPADARAKGICKEGTQKCTNNAWSDCSGDVQPVEEVCDDGLDNDCDGLKDDCGDFRCTVTMQTQDAGSDMWAFSVARDSALNAIITGHFRGTVDFGGKKLISNGGYDVVIAKYSPECQLIWAENFGSAKHDGGFAVKVADNDDIVVGGIGGEFTFTGDTGADVDLGGGLLPHTGPAGAFVARYDQNGKHKWSHLYGGNGIPRVQDLAIAKNGDIVVAGYGGGDYGGGLAPPSTVVARYTKDGAFVWQTLLQYGVSNGINTQPEGMDIDGSDRAIVTGSYDAGKSWHNGVATGSHNTAYLAAVSSDGKTAQQLRSARTIYSPLNLTTDDPNIGNSVAAFGTTLFWAGYCVGPIDFGGGAIPSRNGWDAFVASYDGQNKHLFSFLDGDTKADIANDIALDSQSNILLVGQAWPQGVIVKYSSGGRWLRAKTSPNPEILTDAVGKDDSLATSGDFYTTVDLGNGTQTPKGNHDGFLTFYDP